MLWEHARVQKEMYDSEARLAWVLAALAGVLGATAFTHSEGYFVTFMTGTRSAPCWACFVTT